MRTSRKKLYPQRLIDELKLQYCEETGMLQVRRLITLSWAASSSLEQPFLDKIKRNWMTKEKGSPYTTRTLTHELEMSFFWILTGLVKPYCELMPEYNKRGTPS